MGGKHLIHVLAAATTPSPTAVATHGFVASVAILVGEGRKT